MGCLTTALSLSPSNQWWIRVLDFPRVPMIWALALIALACVLLVRRGRVIALAALAISIGYQVWRIHDYTALVSPELPLAGAAGSDRACFKALSLNVYQYNRDFDRTIALIRRESPDILILMETDPRWNRALQPLLAAYPQRAAKPLDNTYGMIFASRLPVRAARFVITTDADTPTLYAQLDTSEGRPFDLIGLHPRPPVPGQDTTIRDRKIASAARKVPERGIPVLALGDFNDVAWSHTTQGFKREGGFRDPRVGRGTYASFPARHIRFGWPLDQIFVTPQFTIGDLRIGDEVGSDHRPLIATLCLRPHA